MIALLVVTACAPTEAATAIIVPSATEPFEVLQDALLPPGMYTSEAFKPQLTYTVPAGWVMYDDEPGQFEFRL